MTLTCRYQRLFVLFFFFIDVFALLVSGSRKAANQAVINDLIKGDRVVLGMGLTTRRMVVILGSEYYEREADNLFIYDMPPSSFQVREPLMVLSNGGPARKLWPAFHRAAKGRTFANVTVTLEGKKHDYLFVIFQHPTDVLLYNIDAGRVEAGYQGMEVITNILNDPQWGMRQEVNFSGISTYRQAGFKSYNLYPNCTGNKSCPLQSRFTFWKCDSDYSGGAGSPPADLVSCGHLSKDWYFSMCFGWDWTYGIEHCPQLDTRQVDQIWGGFTAPEPDPYDDFKKYKDIAGRQFLVLGGSAFSVLMMRSLEHEIERAKEPYLDTIYNAQPAYYNFSNFFQAGFDDPFDGRGGKPTSSAIVVFTILLIILCLFCVGCCLAGYYCCYKQKRAQKKASGKESVAGKEKIGAAGVRIDIGGGGSISKQTTSKTGKSGSKRSKSKRRPSKSSKKRGGSSSKHHHPHRRSKSTLKRGGSSKRKMMKHTLKKHHSKKHKSATGAQSPHRHPSKQTVKVTGKGGWWVVKN